MLLFLKCMHFCTSRLEANAKVPKDRLFSRCFIQSKLEITKISLKACSPKIPSSIFRPKGFDVARCSHKCWNEYQKFVLHPLLFLSEISLISGTDIDWVLHKTFELFYTPNVRLGEITMLITITTQLNLRNEYCLKL